MKKAKYYRKNPRSLPVRVGTVILRMSTAGLAVLLCVAAFLLLPTTGRIQNTEQIPQESVSQPAEEPFEPSQELEPETPSTPPPDKPLESEPLPEPETASITILGVGDNLIHDGIYKQANRRAAGQAMTFPRYMSGLPPTSNRRTSRSSTKRRRWRAISCPYPDTRGSIRRRNWGTSW